MPILIIKVTVNDDRLAADAARHRCTSDSTLRWLAAAIENVEFTTATAADRERLHALLGETTIRPTFTKRTRP